MANLKSKNFKNRKAGHARLSTPRCTDIDIRSLLGDSFTFEFEGWSAGKQKREEYERRLHFHNLSVNLRLDEIRRMTDVYDFERVKWQMRTLLPSLKRCEKARRAIF